MIYIYLFFQSWFTFHGEVDNFTQEVEKHIISEFSVLELRLDARGHVYGALAVLLLGMNRICSSMQRLKVLLQRSAVILSSDRLIMYLNNTFCTKLDITFCFRWKNFARQIVHVSPLTGDPKLSA